MSLIFLALISSLLSAGMIMAETTRRYAPHASPLLRVNEFTPGFSGGWNHIIEGTSNAYGPFDQSVLASILDSRGFRATERRSLPLTTLSLGLSTRQMLWTLRSLGEFAASFFRNYSETLNGFI